IRDFLLHCKDALVFISGGENTVILNSIFLAIAFHIYTTILWKIHNKDILELLYILLRGNGMRKGFRKFIQHHHIFTCFYNMKN
ncbi:hypothetical protein ACJX0J_038441, partial [Zea mays]